MAASEVQYSQATLNKFRLRRFRRLSSIITVVSVIYAVLVIQFTPLFKSNQYFLEFFAIAAGTANFLIYRFLPDSFFKPNVNFVLNLVNLAFVGFIVQITGGLASPFAFFYPVIILSSIVTMNLVRTLIFFVLTLELLVAHFLTSSTSVSIPPGSLSDLLFNIARVVLLGTYSIILVSDIYAEEQKNLVVGGELKQRLTESDLTAHLDQEIARRKPLNEVLTQSLGQVANEFRAHLGLIIIRDEENNRWRAVAAHNLIERETGKLNPEKMRDELASFMAKNKKALRGDEAFIKKHLPELKSLDLASILVCPFIFEERVLGLLFLGHHNIKFTQDDLDFLKRLSDRFSLAIANALSLEAQDKLFSENEKITQESKSKMERLEKLLEIKGIEA